MAEQIARHLGQRIVTGRLAPGERVQEMKVAGELDVSRGSVREALLILERRHLVEIFPRRGAMVSQLTPGLVNSLYDIYIELLCMLGRKLMERWSASDLTDIMGQVQELQTLASASQKTGDEATERVIDAGFAVMRHAYGLVENPFLEETLENFRPAISRTYYVALKNFQGEVLETERFFRDVKNAVDQGQTGGLVDAIRRFGEHQRQQVLKTLEQAESA
ncbi:MAG: GntR family transcriptional regulator [Marinobacter sp.]|uniref:GntR family transcriptional regulator n=1 Tax=Marinobacter sp. TaxID=50741 RepID=UPI00299E44C6|nr:GntR family transcriptional regulator [Marinobacter sp.]MDX1755592.1 GntR family transcriptional regulator [Marinobacter sp.]